MPKTFVGEDKQGLLSDYIKSTIKAASSKHQMRDVPKTSKTETRVTMNCTVMRSEKSPGVKASKNKKARLALVLTKALSVIREEKKDSGTISRAISSGSETDEILNKSTYS